MVFFVEPELELEKSDARFNKFALAIEKNLAAFETISEWADVISFLTRLSKTLLSFPQYTLVPRKILLAKRLAQCLNPNLPSGVHQKTLETYGIIFQKIGRDGLINDLSIYCPGLFPFFEFASSSVRLEFLDLVNRFLIPLNDKLRLLLRSLAMALLPGLEEINTECFIRTFSCLEAASKATSWNDLFAALWCAMIFNSKFRVPSCNFITKALKLNPSLQAEEIIFGGTLNAAITTFVLGLADSQPLVVRSMLDLLIALIPVNFKQLMEEQRVLLAIGMLKVLLRRDMSLSRRVYQWLLDGQSSKESDEETRNVSPGEEEPRTDYLLLASLKEMVVKGSEEFDDKQLSSVPEILVILSDRPDFLGMIKKIIIELLTSISGCEIFKRLSSLPRTTNSWEAFLSIFGHEQIWFELADYIKEDNGSVSMATLASTAARMTEAFNFITQDSLPYVIAICRIMLSKVKLDKDFPTREILSSLTNMVIKASECKIFGSKLSSSAASDRQTERAVDSYANFEDLAGNYIAILTLCASYFRDESISKGAFFGELMSFMSNILNLCGDIMVLKRDIIDATNDDIKHAIQFMQDAAMHHKIDNPCIINNIISCLVGFSALLCDESESNLVTYTLVKPIINDCLEGAWNRFSEDSRYYINFRHIFEILPNDLDIFLSGKLNGAPQNCQSIYQKFSEIWTSLAEFSPNLLPGSTLVAIGGLSSGNLDVQLESLHWFRRSSYWISSIYDPIIGILVNTLNSMEVSKSIRIPFYTRPFDVEQAQYALKQIISVLNIPGNLLHSDYTASVSPQTFQLIISNTPDEFGYLIGEVPSMSIARSILSCVIPLAVAEGSQQISAQYGMEIESIQSLSYEVLKLLIEKVNLEKEDLYQIASVALDKLRYHASCGSWYSQILPLSVALLAIRRGKFEQRDATIKLLEVAAHSLSITVLSDCIDAWCSALSVIVAEELSSLPEVEQLINTVCSTLLARIEPLKAEAKGYELALSLVNGLCALIGASIKSNQDGTAQKANFVISIGNRPASMGALESATLNEISKQIPLLFNAIADIGGIPKARVAAIVDYIVSSNSAVCFFRLLEYIQSVIELNQGGTLFAKCAFMKIALGNTLILDYSLEAYQSTKDKKSQFSRISLESILHAIYYISLEEIPASRFTLLGNLLNSILRDIMSSPSRHRAAIYLLILIVSNISKRPEFKDSLAGEIQDNFLKLTEFAITVAAKSNDPSQWSEGEIDPFRRTTADIEQLVKFSKDKASGKAFLALVSILIPYFQNAWKELERAQPVFLTILTQLIFPNIKSKCRVLSIVSQDSIRCLLKSPSLMPLWKREFWESFFLENQTLIFETEFIDILVNFLRQFLQSDGDKILDIINRIQSSQSTNLFQSRELENFNRSLMVRRLAIICFCAEVEVLRLNLPSLQERIIDVLRGGVSSTACEAYLLVRVLVYRLSEELPAAIWPTLFADILYLFKQFSITKDPPPMLIQTVTRATKLLDLITNMPVSTPLLHFGMAIGDAAGAGQEGIGIISEVARGRGWLLLENSISPSSLRAPLLLSKISDPEELRIFFTALPQRFAHLEVFQNPPSLSRIEQELLCDFAEGIQLI